MRIIERTNQFKRDYKREIKGPHQATLKRELVEILTKLAGDEPLADRHRDHFLSGEWKNYRNCHVKPDLVLIYRKVGARTLRLVRLGSHSEIGI